MKTDFKKYEHKFQTSSSSKYNMFSLSLLSTWLLTSFCSVQGQYLSEGAIPWGCGPFKYYNATLDQNEIPGIIEQALFEVDNYINYLYAIEGVPSISFGIVYGNSLIHYYSVGYTDLNDSNSQPTKDSIYRIGSISKVFTTLLAYIMRDNELISSFDDPIYKYNTNFSIYNPWGIDEKEQNGETITIKHLASQVSGLPREVPCLNGTTEKTCYLEDTNIVLERLKNEFMLIHPTDTQGSYSNLAYSLLGNILPEYVGTTYEDALNEWIFTPLGATHTGLYLNSEQSKYAANGYSGTTIQPWTDIGWESPAGQLFSSVNDLSLLMSQYFASIPSKYSLNDNSYSKNIINNFDFLTYPTTLREMLRPVFINPDLQSGFGSPWEMQSFENGGIKKWIRSKGGNIYGFSTNMAMIPEMRLGTIGLVNDNTDGSLYTFGPLEILYKAFNSWLIAMQSEYKTILPSKPSIYEGDYYYEGSYYFTIELSTLNNNDWLMLYGFAVGIYGTLSYYENDDSGSTFIFLDPNVNTDSCWLVTLDALDSTTVKFDVSSDGNSVTGLSLIDNNYGNTFSNNGQDDGKFYLTRKAKNTYKNSNKETRYSQYKAEKMKRMKQNTQRMFGNNNKPLQPPLRKSKRNTDNHIGRNNFGAINFAN